MKALASALLASAIYLSLAACSPEPPTTVSISRVGFLAVSPVSNLAHLISGNNALVEITSDATNPDSFVITVNDQPASAQIAEHAFADGVHHYRMLLTELQPGNNLVRVETGEAAAALSLVNYPITGPIFSGAFIARAGFAVAPAITCSSGMPRCKNSDIGTSTLAG